MALDSRLDALRRQPVARQLKLANLFTSGVVIFLAGVLLLALQAYLAGSVLLRQARTAAAMTGENLSAAMVFGDRKSGADILAALRAFDDIAQAQVRDADGRPFASYTRAGLVSAPAAALDAGAYRFDADHLSVSQSISYQGRRLGSIQIEAEMAPAYRRIAWYALLVWLVMVVSLGLANAVLVRLQRIVTEPLLALAKTAETVSRHGDFSIRAKVYASADIGLLAGAFNTMLERIEKRDAELLSEIAERKRVEAKLDRLAHFDNVTGLHNRYYFNDRLAAAVAQAQQSQRRAMVMFLDLDNFKAVNDTLGHDTGDELLRIVSRRLGLCVRLDDTVARIGGDEFAIILENVGDQQVGEQIAQKCLTELAKVIRINDNEIYVSGSIGISSCPDDAIDVHALLKFSDTAMYYAKNAGKNTYRVFTPGMQGEAQKRFAMNGNLRRALERKEFVLHYQPQIDLHTGRISGAEALIRWAHPDLGTISPLEFIPIAEETGLIIPIGNWVLREACLQLKAWHDHGLTHLRMAVNLSSRQLSESNFVQMVLDTLAETGASPHALELELTESMLMDANQQTIAKLDALRAAGLMLAIDDFGTGYSSMTYLKRFPINTLKVDRSFVHDLLSSTRDVAITKAIISMAHSLDLQVVAEGIETVGQAALLLSNGCNSGQGFYYSKAVGSDEILALVLAESERERASG
ncbi:MAG: EAL domain-containing protein [Pseudomonadota bacterium]